MPRESSRWSCWFGRHDWRIEEHGIYLYTGTPRERQCDIVVCRFCRKAKVSYGGYPPRPWPRSLAVDGKVPKPAEWPESPHYKPAAQPKGTTMTKQGFTKEMGATVRLSLTDEAGTVLGRAEYDHAENAYYVRYVAADGRQCESWWAESAIA